MRIHRSLADSASGADEMRLCRRGLPGWDPPLLPECWGLRAPRVAGAGIVVGPWKSGPDEEVEENEDRLLAGFIVPCSDVLAVGFRVGFSSDDESCSGE